MSEPDKPKQDENGSEQEHEDREKIHLDLWVIIVFIILILLVGISLGFAIQAYFQKEISGLITPQQWLSFAQFLLGTVALGAFAILINQEIQRRRLDIKELLFLSKFRDLISKQDIDQKIQIANFFSYMSPSKKTKNDWKKYHTEMQRENKKAKELNQKINKLEKELISTTEQKDEISIKIESLRAERDVIIRAMGESPRYQRINQYYYKIYKNKKTILFYSNDEFECTDFQTTGGGVISTITYKYTNAEGRAFFGSLLPGTSMIHNIGNRYFIIVALASVYKESGEDYHANIVFELLKMEGVFLPLHPL